MVSKAFSMGLFGMHAFKVEVECDLSAVCLTLSACRTPPCESRNRVRAALKNCGFDFPVSRITMNLAPADVQKGPVYDLPLLISLLKATGQLNATRTTAFLRASFRFRCAAFCAWCALPWR